MALLEIPLSTTRGTYFDFEGVQVNISKFRLNPYLGKDTWIIDISWLDEEAELRTVGGLVLYAGVDILKQHDTPLPNLFLLSDANNKEDPISSSDIRLYIKEIE